MKDIVETDRTAGEKDIKAFLLGVTRRMLWKRAGSFVKGVLVEHVIFQRVFAVIFVETPNDLG
jgi:hypothetical protein